MRYLTLCVEVPDDLERFDFFELIHDNGKSFFLFYKGKKVIRSLFPRDIFAVSGDLNFVIQRTIEFYNYSNYEEFLNGLSKKNEKELVSKEFSSRARRKKHKLG